MVERPSVFFIRKSNIDKVWLLDWRGFFGQGIKWDAPLSLDFWLGLWRLHIKVVQVERPWEFMAKGLDFGLGLWRLHTMPGQRLPLLCFIGYMSSAHFFGHSIPRPLNFDGHSVKRPLETKAFGGGLHNCQCPSRVLANGRTRPSSMAILVNLFIRKCHPIGYHSDIKYYHI
jgi:hypothetical protein